MANFFSKILNSILNKDAKSELKSGIEKQNKNDVLLDFEINEHDKLKHGWDEVFYATFSGDFDKMLKAVDIKTIPINRHYLLQSIVNHSYKLREQDKFRSICLKYAEQHLKEFDEIMPILLSKDQPTRILTFQLYSTILVENGDFEKAIEVCQKAITYGLKDGTKGCYLGRIERIKKKLN